MSWICYNQHLRDDTRFGDQPGEWSSVITQSWLCCWCQVEELFPGEGRCISFDLFRSWECFFFCFFLLPTFCWLTFWLLLLCTVTLVQTLIILYMPLYLGFRLGFYWNEKSMFDGGQMKAGHHTFTQTLHQNQAFLLSLSASLFSLWKADSSITNRCDWISHLSLMSPWSQRGTLCIPIRCYLGFCPPCWQKPIFSFYYNNLQWEGLHYVLLDEGVIIWLHTSKRSLTPCKGHCM